MFNSQPQNTAQMFWAVRSKNSWIKISVRGSIRICRSALFFLPAATTCLGLPGSLWAYTAFDEAGTQADRYASLSHTRPRAWHCLNTWSATVDVDGDTGGRDKAEVKQAGTYECIISYHFSRGITQGATRGTNCGEERGKKKQTCSLQRSCVYIVLRYSLRRRRSKLRAHLATWHMVSHVCGICLSFSLSHTRAHTHRTLTEQTGFKCV